MTDIPDSPRRVTKARAPRSSRAAKPQAGDLSSLQAAVNDASSRAGALWLSFLTFMAYLTMTVGAVTHEALLKQKPIKLPVLNVDLPLVGFFWIAPLFFLLFHFYLFLQMNMLVRKVASYDATLRATVPSKEEQEEYRKRLDSFLVVQFLCGAEEERNGMTSRLLRVVAVITLVILPLFLLLQFQLTFLPYHDSWVTWVHRIAVLFDIRLSWIFWFAIRRGDGNIYLPEFQFAWNTLFKGKGFWKSARSFFSYSATTFRGAWRAHKLGVVSSALAIFVSFFVLAYKDEPISRIVQFPDRASNWEFRPVSDWFLHGPINMVEGRPRAWFSNVLIVPNKQLVAEDAVDKDFPSLSLRGRNLSGAVLIGSDLRSADFTGANLNEAHLDRAQLSRARFGCASPYDKQIKPGWPNDECTWLQRASLAQAKLQAVDLKRARMHGAILIAANLQGADLSGAQLQGAMLSKASLEGVFLDGANLSYAYLDRANLIGAKFSNARMQGALLSDTRFHLASIQFVSTASFDREPVRIAKDREGADESEMATRIVNQFLYATITPADPVANAEEVIADFDVRKGLNKFRQEAISLLLPYNIVEPDFETTYERSVEKRWNEISQLVMTTQIRDEKKIKDYLIGFACDAGSSPFITAALIKSERIMEAGKQALEVIESLKRPADQCPGSQKLTTENKVILGSMEQRARSLVNVSAAEAEKPEGVMTAKVSPDVSEPGK